MIRVQQENFSVAEEYQRLLVASRSGAVVMFVGLVRDFSQDNKRFYLQHYPGMTEKVLRRIADQACQRWPLKQLTMIHRVGELGIDEQIVFVGASAQHRKAAFAACEFMIDLLKTQAPFWKKEGGHWVQARESDQQAADTWLKN